MAMHDKLRQYLPGLRAYAAAMSGSSAAGDELVELCILMALDRPAFFKGSQCRLVLFRALHQVLAAPPVRLDLPGQGAGHNGTRALSGDEMAFAFLTGREGFARDEAAFIIGLDLPTAERINRSLAPQPTPDAPARVLILEGDALTVRRLAGLCRKEGLQIVGQTEDPAEAVRLARRTDFEIMLVDYSLEADRKSGLWAVREARGHRDFVAIHVTGSPDEIADAMSGRDRLVPKPFLPSAISFALRSALDGKAGNCRREC